VLPLKVCTLLVGSTGDKLVLRAVGEEKPEIEREEEENKL